MEILRSLAQGDKHGYALHEELERTTSTIYDHLDELADAGMVTHEMQASERGRDRKVYSLTDDGRELFTLLQKNE
jgi:DNA-binding PadR family transcriptional regulator